MVLSIERRRRVPADGLRRSRLDCRVPQDLSDRRCRAAGGAVSAARVHVSGVAQASERERWNVRQRQRRAARPLEDRRSIAAVRHVFLEEDGDGPGLLAALTTRPDLPPPSYVLHSSPGRLHVFWRTRRFERAAWRPAETPGARARHGFCCDVVRADDASSGLCESQARTTVARPRRVSASGNVLAPADFPVLTTLFQRAA